MVFFSAPKIPKIVKFCKYTALSVCQCRLLLKVKFKSRNLPNFQLIGPFRTSMSLSSNSSMGPTKLCSSVVSASDNTSLVRVLQSPLLHRERHSTDQPLVTQHPQTKSTKKSACKKSVSRKPHGLVAQNKKQSGRKNHVTTEMTCLAMTRGSRTANSHSSGSKNSERTSRGSAAKGSLITGAVSSTDTGVKGGTFGKDKSKKGMTISSTDSATSKIVETDHHQHTPTASPLAQVEGDSPQTIKKSVRISNPSSVSGQRVTGSGRQNMPSGERRRNGGRIDVKLTGRRAATGKYNGKTEKEVSSFSKTDSVCTIRLSHPSTPSPSSVAGYTKRRLPISKQGGVSLTHWNKSSHSSHIQLPTALRIPQRNLATTKCWSQGKRKVELKDIAAGLGRMHYRSVIVMSGAGISTPSGIPDFRTPGTGLYDNLQKYHLPEPSAVFDAAYFNHNPRPFFSLAKELYPGRFSPNLVHCFVRLLQDKGVLLRNYTQNIDGLERLAGVCGGKLVEAHGSFSTASCTHCHSKQDTEEVKRAIFSDQVPKCKHKYCNGVVKPDIVFFGEDLPQRFYSLQLADFSQCDLLLVMGTSLEVEPFASLVTLSRHTVPRLLLNRELVGPFRSSRRCRHTDVAVCGDIIDSVREVVHEAGWEAELKEIQQTISQLHAGTSHPCDSASSTTCTHLDSSLKRLTLEDAHPPQPPDTDSDSSSDSSTSSVSSESSSESD